MSNVARRLRNASNDTSTVAKHRPPHPTLAAHTVLGLPDTPRIERDSTVATLLADLVLAGEDGDVVEGGLYALADELDVLSSLDQDKLAEMTCIPMVLWRISCRLQALAALHRRIVEGLAATQATS